MSDFATRTARFASRVRELVVDAHSTDAIDALFTALAEGWVGTGRWRDAMNAYLRRNVIASLLSATGETVAELDDVTVVERARAARAELERWVRSAATGAGSAGEMNSTCALTRAMGAMELSIRAALLRDLERFEELYLS